MKKILILISLFISISVNAASIGSILPVGTLIHSMLTTTQFASVYGTNWVLMDGRSVTGSKYASVTGNTTIPDATGRFLRGKGGNNPDGDLALGSFQSDAFGSHSHSMIVPISTASGSGLAPYYRYSATGNDVAATTGDWGQTSTTGGNETRPDNITVNIFIRIN